MMSKDCNIIFITGASRSGTSMLNRILGNNSLILGLPELHYFGDCFDPNKEDEKILDRKTLTKLSATIISRAQKGIWYGKNPAHSHFKQAEEIAKHLKVEDSTAARIFAITSANIAAEAGKKLVVEQTPRYIFYARRLLNLYPDCRIIHMIRDPHAVLASQKNRWRRKWLGGSNVPWSEIVRIWINYHPVTISKLWLHATQAAQRLENNPRVFILKFEDLVQDPEEQVRRLCEFAKVGYESSMLDISVIGSSNRKDLEGKRGVAKSVLTNWHGRLSKAEIAICEHITSPLMQLYGYNRLLTMKLPVWSVGWQLLKYPVHVGGLLMANPRRTMIQIQALIGAKYSKI